MKFLKDQYLTPSYTNIPKLNEIKMWAINLKYVDRNSWTNYNAVYSIARTVLENNSAFLMHESTLHTIIQQRIATNKTVDEINDQTNEDSDVKYIYLMHNYKQRNNYKVINSMQYHMNIPSNKNSILLIKTFIEITKTKISQEAPMSTPTFF